MEIKTDTADSAKVADKAQDQGSKVDPHATTSQGDSKASPQGEDISALAAKIKALESDNKKYRDKEKTLDKEREEALQRKLEEEGKYKELISLHEKKLAEVPSLTEEVERYKIATKAHLDARLGVLSQEQKSRFENAVKATGIESDAIRQLSLLDTLFDGMTVNPQGASGTPASQVNRNPKAEQAFNDLRFGDRDSKMSAQKSLKEMGLL